MYARQTYLPSLHRQAHHHAFVAGGLSLLVPGLGQLYNGQLLKGVLIFFTSFLIIPYIYGVIDAYRVARNDEVWANRHLLPARCATSDDARAARSAAEADAWSWPRSRRKLDFEAQLVEAARAKDGTLSVTEGVIATGRSFKEVETKLDQMLRAGYVDIGNRPNSGVVIYRFTQI